MGLVLLCYFLFWWFVFDGERACVMVQCEACKRATDVAAIGGLRAVWFAWFSMQLTAGELAEFLERRRQSMSVVELERALRTALRERCIAVWV